MWSLRRWWRNLWRTTPATTDPGPPPERAGAAGAPAVDATIDAADDAARVPPRRRYTVPHHHDDPQLEARLGAVLEALRAGPLRRAELGSRVGAVDWGPGRLDAVVDHGVATGVLLETDGAVRARYAD
jgi:hypothetical protein